MKSSSNLNSWPCQGDESVLVLILYVLVLNICVVCTFYVRFHLNSEF